MNLFLLLGQLGLAWDLSGQPLLPIGTVYDPFVCRGLETPCCAARSSPVPTGSSTPPRSIKAGPSRYVASGWDAHLAEDHRPSGAPLATDASPCTSRYG
jgi:hypothetical protein